MALATSPIQLSPRIIDRELCCDGSLSGMTNAKSGRFPEARRPGTTDPGPTKYWCCVRVVQAVGEARADRPAVPVAIGRARRAIDPPAVALLGQPAHDRGCPVHGRGLERAGPVQVRDAGGLGAVDLRVVRVPDPDLVAVTAEARPSCDAVRRVVRGRVEAVEPARGDGEMCAVRAGPVGLERVVGDGELTGQRGEVRDLLGLVGLVAPVRRAVAVRDRADRTRSSGRRSWR